MKFKIKKVRNLSIISIISTIIVLIFIVFAVKTINETGKLKIKKENELNLDGITYKIYKYADGQGKVCINFRDDKGIAEIYYPNEENILKCNGKKNVAIEYGIEKNKNYEFKIKTIDGREIVSNETVNDEFLYSKGINYEEKKIGAGYKIIDFKYFHDVNGPYKYYYKIGENGEWEEYKKTLWLFDYDLVKDNLINTEDNTITIYTKSVNSANEEIIISKKYDVDANATEISITADSLLQVASEDWFKAGAYKITVQDETYSLHVYEFDESQIWSDNMTFGNEKDVATSNIDMAKNMVVVKINGDLTINEGVTVTSYADENGYGGPKGMFIYCTGTLTNNGTISMAARGAYAEGQNVYLWKNNNNTYEYVPKDGSSGGARVSFTGNDWQTVNGNSGENAVSRGTGGGGSGAVSSCYSNGNSGAGAKGTSYAGGAGRRRMYN